MNCMDLMKENILVVAGRSDNDGDKKKSELLKKEKNGKANDYAGERVEQIEQISVLP